MKLAEYSDKKCDASLSLLPHIILHVFLNTDRRNKDSVIQLIEIED